MKSIEQATAHLLRSVARDGNDPFAGYFDVEEDDLI